MQLLTPAECTVAYVTKLRRDDNFLQHNTIKEDFFANLRESWRKPYQFKATQWANVAESRAVISVPMRLTSTSLLQFSQARGPILWKPLGKQSCSTPAPQNAPSGSARGLLVWSMSKVMVVSFFFPRVRTPCGHGAQVIIEGREIQSDGGEKDKDNPTTKPNKTNHSPQAETPPPSSISSVLG